MPDLPNEANPARREKEFLPDGAITRPERATLPKLSDVVNFTYSPSFNSEGASFAVQDYVAHNAPPLPDPNKVERFYAESLPHLHIPTAISAQSETLNLDSMLAMIRPKRDQHAARILSVALNLWRAIDGRAFGAPPYQSTPFKGLKVRAQTAQDLLNQTKTAMRTIKATFVAPPERVLQTFMKSVSHYRGEPAWRSVHEATLLAAYELVHDAGITPHIPRPEMQRADDSRAKDPVQPNPVASQETKPRKVLDYGRPEHDGGEPDTPRSNEPSDAEIRRKMLDQASIEGETFLYNQRLKEYHDLKEEIRKPRTSHERYGRLTTLSSTPNNPGKLSGIPDWIQHSIDVAGSDSTQDSPRIPPMQIVALEIADWAAKFIHYTELHAPPGAAATWDLAWLQNLLVPTIKYHAHCKHVVDVVEDLSQQIRELGGYESLRREDQDIVDTLSPARNTTAAIEIKNSWSGEPISREVVGQASIARAQEEQIRLLALTFLKNRPGELRFIEDSERAWKIAMEMAKVAVKHPRRLLG